MCLSVADMRLCPENVRLYYVSPPNSRYYRKLQADKTGRPRFFRKAPFSADRKNIS